MDFSSLKTTIFVAFEKFFNYSPTLLFASMFAVVFGLVTFIGEFFVFPKKKVPPPAPTRLKDHPCKDSERYGLRRSTSFKRQQQKSNKKRLTVFKKQAIDMIREDVAKNKMESLVKMTPTISPGYCTLFRRRKRLRDSLSENKENDSKFTTPPGKLRDDKKENPSTYVLRSRKINF